jgi:hypothetical protein
MAISITHFLPRWINKRLQKWGERRRSAKARLEPEANLPFPYNDAVYLEAYIMNRKIAEPDFEAYWSRQQAIVDQQIIAARAVGPRYD